MHTDIKIGISAKFHARAPVFYGEANRHIQYLETPVARWIAKNKGLPLMIPSESGGSDITANVLDVSAYARELDALILQGGVDVHPSFYGGEVVAVPKYPFDITRDRYELKLIEAFLREQKPILGICRGFQLLNVFFGGTLHQELHERGYVKHLDATLEEGFTHQVDITPGGILSKIYRTTGSVVSIHHQGVDRLGKGLDIEAVSQDDKLIEAFSSTENGLVLGVQWHPEFHGDKKADELDAIALLNLFITAVRNRRFFGDTRLKKRKPLEFSNSASLTLGAELELQLINPKTLDLLPVAPALLQETEKRTSKIKCEIFQSMIEIETDVCESATQIESELKETTKILLECADAQKILVGATGIHPFGVYTDRVLTPERRYKDLVESRRWIARRAAIFGLHCHVGVKSPDEAILLYRLYMSVAPILLGLSSSSPFYQSDLSGLHSVRATFFESMPSGGHPPILESWSQFEGLYGKMLKSKSIASHKDLWWDIRPSLNYGTIEIRVCDSMPTIEENAALVALIHLFGYAYLNARDGFTWPALNEWSYRENKWRAIRYGLDFDFIFNEEGQTIPAPDFLSSFFEAYADLILKQGYEKYAARIVKTLKAGTPADRLMKKFEDTKDLPSVVRHYVDELRAL